jgi:hypothetical protein
MAAPLFEDKTEQPNKKTKSSKTFQKLLRWKEEEEEEEEECYKRWKCVFLCVY